MKFCSERGVLIRVDKQRAGSYDANHHGMARRQVVVGGTTSNMEGSWEYNE
jgi:hypothetical protein